MSITSCRGQLAGPMIPQISSHSATAAMRLIILNFPEVSRVALSSAGRSALRVGWTLVAMWSLKVSRSARRSGFSGWAALEMDNSLSFRLPSQDSHFLS